MGCKSVIEHIHMYKKNRIDNEKYHVSHIMGGAWLEKQTLISLVTSNREMCNKECDCKGV